MKWSINRKSLTRWFRIIHRDLGFLMVGICLVYGLSGMLLNHMKGKDPAFKTEQKTLQLGKNLDKDELAKQWTANTDLPAMKKIIPAENNNLRVTYQGGMGMYNAETGTVEYEINKKRPFIYWINKLHYNQVKGWSPMADLFAVSLIFFAVSGLVMVRGKKGIAGSGKWYLLIGICIPVAYVILS